MLSGCPLNSLFVYAEGIRIQLTTILENFEVLTTCKDVLFIRKNCCIFFFWVRETGLFVMMFCAQIAIKD